MKARAYLLLGLLAAAADFAFAQTSQPAKLDKPLDFENVGLRIALPAGLTAVAPPAGNPAMLFTARQGPQQSGDFVILTAQGIPPDKAPALKPWAETMAVRDQLDRQVKAAAVSSAEFKAGKVEGWQVVSKVALGQRQGLETFTAWVQPAVKDKLAFCYALTIGAGSDDAAAAAALVKAVCESVVFSPIRSPSAGELPPLLVGLKLESEGLSLCLPAGWYVAHQGRQEASNLLLSAAAVDYTVAKALPNLTVMGVRVNTATLKGYGTDEYISAVAEQLKAANKALNWTLVSSGRLRVSGQAATHIVSRLDIAGEVCTQVRVDVPWEGRLLTLELTWRGQDVKPVTLGMNKILREVKLSAPTAATTRGG